MNDYPVINIDAVKSRMLTLRGQQVLLDRDVAAIYDVQTREINQAVCNNSDKFPEGFIWELSKEEVSDLRSKFLTANISPKSRVTELNLAVLKISHKFTRAKGKRK